MAKIDLVVLGFLKTKPMYGYEIAGFFEKHGIDSWNKIKRTSVYKALNRLEEKKFIQGKLKVQENSPPKKVYHITAQGNDYFFQILDETLCSKKCIDPMEFWSALRFIKGNISKEKFISIIDNRLAMMQLKKETLEENRIKAKEKGDLPPKTFYLKIMIETFRKIDKIVQDSLHEMKRQANLAKNQDTFLKENTNEN